MRPHLVVLPSPSLDQNLRLFERVEDLPVEELIAAPSVDVIPVTLTTADRFSRIGAALRKKGTPIPTNDTWIAAQAMEAGAVFLSSDCHFEAVDGLAGSPSPPPKKTACASRSGATTHPRSADLNRRTLFY